MSINPNGERSLGAIALSLGKSDTYFYRVNPVQKRFVLLHGKGSYAKGQAMYEEYTQKKKDELYEIMELFDNRPYALARYFMDHGYITQKGVPTKVNNSMAEQKKSLEAIKWNASITNYLENNLISIKGLRTMKRIIKLFNTLDRIEAC